MLSSEPPISVDDTQPRVPVIQTLDRDPPVPEVEDEPSVGGCANPLLILFVMLSLVLLFVAIVGLAGVAGFRDGTNDFATRRVNTQVADVNTQVAHIAQDVQGNNWDRALARCIYVATLQPGDPAMARCITQAQQALSATPTPTVTLTATPNPPTSTLMPTNTPTAVQTGAPSTSGTALATSESGATPDASGFSPQEWLARAQEALRTGDYTTAENYLEALRDGAPTFDTQEVTKTLCSTYETLGGQYENSAQQLSKMVQVIHKAIKLNCHLTLNTWDFTINVAQLYLDAKGFYEAGNYSVADRDYNVLMSQYQAGNFLDTKKLACQTFGKAGDTKASKANTC